MSNKQQQDKAAADKAAADKAAADKAAADKAAADKAAADKAAADTANTAARLSEALGGDANKTPERDESVGGSAEPGAGTVPAPGADESFRVVSEGPVYRVCETATRCWKELKPAKAERKA